MYIRSIHIGEFGSLLDRDFRFSDGINLIEGANESGKSTILAFIRFMLYGLPRRAAGETVSERERALSWQNGAAEGSMEIVHQNKGYRIERHGHLRSSGARESYTESCHIFELESGMEVFKGEVPGKVFLGMSTEMFFTTACIRQLECSAMNSDEINASIENLLFSADQEIDTQKVSGKLDDLRRSLLYKNGKGGKLFELETQKTLLESRLETAKQNAQSIIAKEAAVEKLKAVSEKAKKQAEQAEAQIALYDTATALRRFETLHAYEAQHAALENDLKTLCREKGYRDALPDRETLSALKQLSDSLSDAQKSREFAKETLEKTKQSPCGDRELAAFYEKTDREGGKQTLCAQFLTHVRRRGRNKAFSVIGFILGALLIGSAVAFATIFDRFSTLGSLSYYLLAAGAVLLACGVGALSACLSASKKIAQLIGKIGLSDASIGISSLTEHIEICRKNHELCHQYDTANASAAQLLEDKEEQLKKAVSNAVHALDSIGVPREDDSPNALLDRLYQTHESFSEICHEREKIESKLDTLVGLMGELRTYLGDQDETSLKAALGTYSLSDILDGFDIEKIRLSYNYSKTQHSLNEQKKIATEKELIALSSTSENPAKVSAKLAEVKEELEKNRLKYNAIITAYDTLSAASENLRCNVTPKLRIRAGELMDILTGGRYRDLGVSADMKITVIADHMTRNIDALSKGTKDAAYICLRIALAELLGQESMPPLIFDESFAQLDDDRTFAMLNMLFNYTADGTQSLLFTCHSREGEMLRKIGNFNHQKIERSSAGKNS